MAPKSPKKPRAGRPSGPHAAAASSAEGLPPEIAELPFEAALTQLEGIVDELEEGDLPLEEALSRFERGIHLSRHLESQLRLAEARVQKLVGGSADAPRLVPMGEAGEEEASFEAGAGADPEEPEEADEDEAGDDGGDRLF